MKDAIARLERLDKDLWSVYEWASMAGFASGGSQGVTGQKGIGDPTGSRAIAGALGHYDDPSIRAAVASDEALINLWKELAVLERLVIDAKRAQ